MEDLHTESLQGCFKDLVTEEQHRVELSQTNIQSKSNDKLFSDGVTDCVLLTILGAQNVLQHG